MRQLKLLVCSAVVIMAVGLTSCSGKPPPNLGIRDGQLSPCPDKPNCVSSQATDKPHFIEPLGFSVQTNRAQRALISVLPGMEGAKVMTTEPLYVRAEFTSNTFKFVDDVEFLIDPLSNIIHVRSASRLGYSDLGVNRKRVEAIRQQFNKALETATPG